MRTRTSLLPSALLLCLFFAAPAHGYGWMIRHGYTNCTSCHVDPSGAGLLKPYGRAQQELLVTALYGKNSEELDPKPGMFFGGVPLPDWFNAGLSLRPAELYVHTPQGGASRFILMVADARLEASVGPVHAVATVGYSPQGAVLAALTAKPTDNVVSREHYLALDLEDQTVMVRAGRMEVPFGLRMIEHPAWVRSETRTDINAYQQYGVAVAKNAGRVRAELMGIAGNFLIRQPGPAHSGTLVFAPDYQERGYSGYGELALAPNFALGLTSLATVAKLDLLTREPNTLRQAHGLFARWAISEPLVLMAEFDALLARSDVTTQSLGYASFLQGDYEPLQGVHFILTAESLAQPSRTGIGGWVSFAYFFLPYCELRVDNILRRYETPQGSTPVVSVMAQLHIST